MKRQNDKQEIAQLLEKFMAGETSVAEEQMLAQYFRTHEVGEEWTEYKEMFALFDSGEVDIELDTDTSEQLNNGDSGKIRMLPKTVREKPKIVALRWLAAAACVLLLIGFFTIKKNGEPVTEAPKIAQISDSAEVKQPVVTPPVTHEETLAQTPPPKQSHRRKHGNVVKPQDENVRYMTDEMVDQLLTRNQQARVQQPIADYKEVENEIKRRGEQLTHDLLAFAEQTINDK